MRPDVKLGVATSLVLVLVAGGYYLFRDGQEEPIPVSDGPARSPASIAQRKQQPTKSPAVTGPAQCIEKNPAKNSVIATRGAAPRAGPGEANCSPEGGRQRRRAKAGEA